MKEMETMNISNIQILNVLYGDNCATKLQAYTIGKLRTKLGCGYTKTAKDLNVLLALGYVNKGYKRGRADTYYITESGIKFLGGVTYEK